MPATQVIGPRTEPNYDSKTWPGKPRLMRPCSFKFLLNNTAAEELHQFQHAFPHSSDLLLTDKYGALSPLRFDQAVILSLRRTGGRRLTTRGMALCTLVNRPSTLPLRPLE